VELDEVVGRVLRRRILLIVSMMAVGVFVVLAAHVGDQTRYVAQARLVLDSPDPTSSAQSGALADTANAMASAPSLVGAALQQVGADRDPVTFGQQNVAVKALGSSGVLQLTVTDTDRQVAMRMANTIAERVIRARQGVTAAASASASDELRKEIAAREEQLALIDARLDATVPDGSVAPSQSQRQLERSRDEVLRRLDKLYNELALIRAERALRPEAAILDRANSATVEPSGLVPELVIGALLGLVLGVGVAALREVLQPTLGGGPSLSRATGAPVLAELPIPPDECFPEDLAEVAENVQLASQTAGVGRVEVMSVDAERDISQFVAALAQALRLTAGGSSPMAAGRRGPFALGDGPRPAGLLGERMVGVDTGGDPRRTGLVLVSPDEARVADLEPVRNLLGITGWPLLGVVVFKTVRSPLLMPRHRRRRPERPDARVDSAVGQA
jgi:capsular polysaccharide biosynthesis protein